MAPLPAIISSHFHPRRSIIAALLLGLPRLLLALLLGLPRLLVALLLLLAILRLLAILLLALLLMALLLLRAMLLAVLLLLTRLLLLAILMLLEMAMVPVFHHALETPFSVKKPPGGFFCSPSYFHLIQLSWRDQRDVLNSLQAT